LARVEKEIDETAAKLWALMDEELAAIKQTLQDLP